MRHGTARPWLVVALALAFLAAGCSSRRATSEWSVEGPIYAMDGSVWVVGDRLVTIAPDARVVGAPVIGSVASVRGTRDEHGSPIGESIEIASTSEPRAAPTAQPPAQSTPTPVQPAATPPPATAAPQPPVTAPPPAARPAAEPKPGPAPEHDDKEQQHGPPAKPGNGQGHDGNDQGRGGKPKGH